MASVSLLRFESAIVVAAGRIRVRIMNSVSSPGLESLIPFVWSLPPLATEGLLENPEDRVIWCPHPFTKPPVAMIQVSAVPAGA